MASPEQLAANRRNARQSRGPQTAEGKQRARMNALRHGGTAALAVLPDEDPLEAAQFREQLRAAFAPCGAHQEALVNLIVDALWRQQRLARVESGILTFHLYEKLKERMEEEAQPTPGADSGDLAHRKAALRQAQDRDVDLGAMAFLRDAEGSEAMGKLSRYETALANRLNGWMRELRELQSGQVEAE